MNNNTLINKIILYTHFKHNENYKDLILFNKTISRQNPKIILNKKNEILGLKNTLRKKNLNIFLYKLIYFVIPKIKKDLIYNNNFFVLDKNLNLNLKIKNKTYFFEYINQIKINSSCVMDINLIFNNNVNVFEKLFYMDKVLNIKI